MSGIPGPDEAALVPDGPPSDAELDLSAAMVRAEAAHVDAMLHALVQRLSSVPGLNVSVGYRPGWFSSLFGDLPYINDLSRRKGPIQRVAITFDANGASVVHSYWLSAGPGWLKCGRYAQSPQRSDAIGELRFSVWAAMLFAEVAQRNIINHESLVALRHLVEHDRLD